MNLKGPSKCRIKFNYGGSGALRQQIEAGAPADVMMSANTKDIDLLKKKTKHMTLIIMQRINLY